MEPENLNSPEPSEKQLAAWFAQLDATPLPDDGFTQRLLTSLPPSRGPVRPDRAPWRIDWLVGILATAGVLWLSPQSAATGWAGVMDLLHMVQVSLLNSTVLLVLGLICGVLALNSPDAGLDLSE